MALTILFVLYCPNPSVCAPLPEGRRVCHLARWHDPPENVLAPMSAPECGGWSERKRAQLTGYNGRKQKKRPSNKSMREGLPHQFPCLSGPYCIRYNCFSCDPNAPVSLRSYFLKVKESGWGNRSWRGKVLTSFQLEHGTEVCWH